MHGTIKALPLYCRGGYCRQNVGFQSRAFNNILVVYNKYSLPSNIEIVDSSIGAPGHTHAFAWASLHFA